MQLNLVPPPTAAEGALGRVAASWKQFKGDRCASSGSSANQRLGRVLFLLLFFLVLAPAVVASHYKGGQITYEDQGGGTYLVTFRSYWRSNAVGSVNPAYSGKHTLNTNLITASYTVLPDGITTEVVQKQTVTWEAPGAYTISWTSCCRLRGGSNFPEGSIGLFAALNYERGKENSSPQFYDLPLFNFTAGVPLRFSFNFKDPEGHPHEYALSTPYDTQDHLYNKMKATGFSISDKGVISWDNPQKGIWLVNVKLSEVIDGQTTGAYVFRDFMLYVSETVNTAPVFEQVEAKTIAEESRLTFAVRATDAEGQQVKLQATGLPLEKGGSFTQTAFGSAAAGTFSWAPPAGAKGPYTVQFVATDNAGFPLSSQLSVRIEVTGCQDRLVTLAAIGEVCVNSAAFALENPFGQGAFTGPGMQGEVFSPALAGVGTHIVTCTYTEGGCTHQAAQEITVVPAAAVDAGPDHNIVFGYGRPSAVELKAKISGDGPHTLTWSTGATGPSLKVWPSQTTTYALTATNAAGCATTDEVTVYVENVACGEDDEKVRLCYDGSPICVSPEAVDGFLAKGASVGSCDNRLRRPRPQEPIANPVPIASFSVYPNPMHQPGATVEFVVTERTPYALELFNLQGVRVTSLEAGVAEAGQVYKVPVNASSLHSGLYLTKLSAGDQVKIIKVMNVQ